jgi:hypothetical protein
VVTASQIPVGPWLLFDSNDEIKAKVFTWGHVAEEDLTQYEIDLRRWGTGSVHMCHAALKSRKMHYEAKILHSNRGIQGAFVLKSRTEWMGADAT